MNDKLKQYQHEVIESFSPEEWNTIANGSISEDKKDFFSIILPPPNVTGTLHLGHAWDAILQDILIRYKKLSNYNVLWVPGMDHAGIATQSKFEKELKKQGKKREDFSRFEFNEMIFDWKENHSKIIRQQWKKLGLCLPLEKERFTLDQESVKVVLSVFKKMYNDNLIYQAEKLVNWDCYLQTAISNIEVINKETNTKIYKIKYICFNDKNITLEVATTRPETMFGDVCLVVNPNDERYNKYLGLNFINPANNEKIKLIADSYVDLNFGTGVMKCTPAHDFNDYEIGKKYNLEIKKCIGLDGFMLNNCLEFSGLSKEECRIKLIEKFQKNNQVIIENHKNVIGYSERSGQIIEPMLSKQWFVKTSEIAKKVINIIKNNPEKINFWPENYSKNIFNYLLKMEDWCISRQLSWGIQIPVWYNKDNGEISLDEKKSNDNNWIQEQDVFDTWFSSGLWPIILTNYYHEKDCKDNKDNYLRKYYPNSVLVTGVDILLFWVSRMMMFGAEITNKMPFENVYLHGLIRDEMNRKMSKSLDNGVDPQKLIKNYGADSVRLFFALNTNSGEDLIFSENKIKNSSYFINKLWNAFNFLIVKKIDLKINLFNNDNLSWSQKWILSKIYLLKKEVKKNYDKFYFNLLSKKISDFIWDDFCNWFIEFIKLEIENKFNDKNYHAVIAYIWNEILIILNPLMPFITDYIFKKIKGKNSSFYNQKKYFENQKWDLVIHPWFFEFIQNIRNIRNELKISNNQVLHFNIIYNNFDEFNQEDLFNIKNLLPIVNCVFDTFEKNVSSDEAIYFPVNEFLFEVKCSKILVLEYKKILNNKIKNIHLELERSDKILSNQNFLIKAKLEKVEEEKNKLKKYKSELNNLQKILRVQKN